MTVHELSLTRTRRSGQGPNRYKKAPILSQKVLSTPKPKAKPKQKLKRGASQLQGGDDGGEGPSQPPQKASRTCIIKAPDRYSE
jgi:hypothetical protein